MGAAMLARCSAKGWYFSEVEARCIGHVGDEGVSSTL